MLWPSDCAWISFCPSRPLLAPPRQSISGCRFRSSSLDSFHFCWPQAWISWGATLFFDPGCWILTRFALPEWESRQASCVCSYFIVFSRQYLRTEMTCFVTALTSSPLALSHLRSDLLYPVFLSNSVETFRWWIPIPPWSRPPSTLPGIFYW